MPPGRPLTQDADIPDMEITVHTILDGIIDTARSRARHGLAPERMMDPDAIAETYWQIAHQPPSAWTHELDLRPASENF